MAFHHPDSYLQDVQEEDEEPARGSGIARMLELSGHGHGVETEVRRLTVALEDLQAQNTMLQDELTLISNVKGELEAELERAKEEFQVEREELEFKINELQMTKESPPTHPDQQVVQEESKESVFSPARDETSLNSDEQQKLNQELVVQCETLIRERNSAQAECQNMRDILQGLGTELSEKTNDFVLQYQTMKEQGANTVRELQEKIEHLSQERDGLLVRVQEFTEEKNILFESIKDLRVKLEGSTGENQKPEEQTDLACELKQSVAELSKRNDEILSQLQMSENMTEDLRKTVNTLTEERDNIQSQLQLREEDMRNLNDERMKEARLLREEKEKELKGLNEEKEDQMHHLEVEREKIEQSLKDEVQKRQEIASALELTVKELSADKVNLLQKLEVTSSEFSTAQEEKKALGSKLADLEAQLEQEVSEKRLLEAKLISLTEEAERAQSSLRALEENQSDVLRNSTNEVEELRARLDELEKERSLLRSSLEEVQDERRIEDVQIELQAHIRELEQERDMLKNSLDEVVKDTEGLQKDLQDMKLVSEKVRDENQKLQAQISLMTQEREEKEEGEMEREMNLGKEREKYMEELTEKTCLISQLRNEISALKVCEAHTVFANLMLSFCRVHVYKNLIKLMNINIRN